MKTRITMLLCLILAFCFVLGACTPTPDPTPEDTTALSTEQPTESDTEQITETMTESETEPKTDSETQPETEPETEIEPGTETEPETESETETETEPETEAETEPMVEILVPDGEFPDLTNLLAGDSDLIDISVDMKNKTPGQLISSHNMMFVTNLAFAKTADGLLSDGAGWDSVGFSQAVTTESFTATAKFSVISNNRPGGTAAPMVGIYCKGVKNLFIDGGIWFAFRDSMVTVYVKNGCETVISSSLPFNAADGIDFRAEGNQQGASVYANDVLIATVELSDQIVIKNADGNQIASCGTDRIDPAGYVRYMSHFSNALLESMTLYGETHRSYQQENSAYSFHNDLPYVFKDKAQYLTALSTTAYSDVVYADALVLGKMFGFECKVDGDTLIMTRQNVTLKFTAKQTGVLVNDSEWAFPTTVYTKDTYMLPVVAFGQMLGYSEISEDGLTVLALQDKTEEAMTMAQERYDLYQSIIYNYDDVECDQTGVGVADPVPYDERLVGIAYTTWHSASRGWGSKTWDMPLCGSYLSDDETVLRYHAELLRDAGVDFVFIDWSNNSNYDPVTMRDQREDFRMIEEATDKLFDVWKTVEGAPKICIFVGPGHQGREAIDSGNHQKKVDQVWRDYVTNPDRADMYFQYQGKPLLVCYGATPTQYGTNPARLWDDDRYTVRWVTGYVGQQSSLFKPKTMISTKYWSWEERGAQTFTVLNGRVEAITVSAATRPQGSEGDSGYIPAAGRENGATLKRQFQRACDLGAGLVIIVSWNEWTTGEQPSAEISKDMEPSVIHGTFYYDLMREQIRKFKGQIPVAEQTE